MSVAIASQTVAGTGLCYYANLRSFQTFTMPVGYTVIDYIRIYAKKQGTPAGTIYFQVYPTSGGNPTGSAIATASLTGANFGYSYAWMNIDYTDFAVSASTMYAIVMYQPSVTGTANGAFWNHTNTDYYGSGTSGYWNTSGAITALSGDFTFEVYGYGVPTGVAATTTGSVNNTSMAAYSDVTGDAGATITSKGFCYSSSTSNPTLSNSYKVVGSSTGAFSTTITGLSAGTTYYIRSYASNAAGTSYGAVKTQATTYSAPSVTTNATTNIDKFTATYNGNVTADNGSTITERGFVYSTVTNPLIGGAGVTKQTVAGTTGAYSYNASSLSAKTVYYVKAYATNAAGTTYGSQTSFETLSAAPSVTSTGVTNLLDTTATFGGNVTSDNGSAITERGVVYSISENPTTLSNKLTVAGTTGAYTKDITGLTAATTYYYRAYAINAYGTSYGANTALRTKPSEPTSFTGVVAGKTQVDLTWVKGDGSTYTIVRRATGSYPTGPGDGTDVYSGVGTTTSSTGLSAGTTYYYRAWAKDGSANYSDETADLTKTTDYGLTDAAEAYSEDTTYASAPANDNKVYIKLSKDGGTTWGTEIEGTLEATNTTVAFGSSTEVIWGETWTGDDIDDTSFRLMITLGSNKTSYQILKDFGFTVSNTYTLTGLVVNVKGYFDTDTSYIDGVSVKCYYGTSILPVKAGAQAYDSTTTNLALYDGTDWKQLMSGAAGTSGDLAQWSATGSLADGPTPPTGTIVGTTDTQTLTNKTVSTGSVIDANVTVTEVLKKVYPVGSIYTNASSSTNPGTLLGFGTWEAFGAGRVMVGKNSSGTFGTIGATGGVETHTLSTAEMPTHSHGVSQSSHNHSQYVTANPGTGGTGTRIDYDTDATGASSYEQGIGTGGANANISIDNAGSGSAHTNLQPYVVVYLWKRTA